MSVPLHSSLEYGVGGDYPGARRGRRAFRFCVATCFGIAFALWFAEGYLRYERSEAQYRMALTLDDPSARAILRNVVRRDTEENETPEARYVEALAAIEEDDLVLARYEEAYRLNPNDAFLLINYGCRLFERGHFREARERFREAGIQPPENALPHYLEAAALAAEVHDGDLSEAIALVTRANNSGEPVRFPQPLWHPSHPRGGAWYVHLRERIVERACAPLYRLSAIATDRATADLALGDFHTWDAWLEAVQTMGRRLVGLADMEDEPGLRQAMAGIEIQLEVLGVRQQLHERWQGRPAPQHAEEQVALLHARERLEQFEQRRAEEYPLRREARLRPLLLIGGTFPLILLVFLLSVLVSRAYDRRRITWALPHSALGQLMLGVGLGAGLLLLLAFTAAQRLYNPPEPPFPLLSNLWYVWLATVLLLGLLYPMLRLPRPEGVAERMELEEEAGEVVRELRQYRRAAFTTLARRYYGILLGGFLCIVCLWALAFRVTESLYPIQLRLLVDGLQAEEHAVVSRIRRELP